MSGEGPHSGKLELVHPAGKPEVPAWRLLMTLGGAGVMAGLLIVLVFRGTQPTIQAHKAEVLRRAVVEVLGEPDHYETLYVYDGALTAGVPEGVDARGLERVFLGYGEDQRPVGFAIAATGPGFQDVVKVLFGYNPATRRLLGMKVLESKETPGLGDRIEKDPRFAEQFEGASPPLKGVKRGSSDPGDPSQVEMITGATISSRAVIRMIDGTLARLNPLLEAYEGGAHP